MTKDFSAAKTYKSQASGFMQQGHPAETGEILHCAHLKAKCSWDLELQLEDFA